MRGPILAGILAVGLVPAGWAQDLTCICQDHGQSDSFLAYGVVTETLDWYERSFGRGEPLAFNLASTVYLNETVEVVVLLSNPAPGPDGLANVTCAVSVTKPSGETRAFDEAPCHNLPVTAAPGAILPTSMQNLHKTEMGDPSGLWIYDIAVTDQVRGATVPLHFEVPVDSTQTRAVE